MSAPEVTIIELWPVFCECHVCGDATLHEQGIAVYENMILPDNYDGEWFGAPVCETCWPVVLRLQSDRPGKAIFDWEVRELMQAPDRKKRVVREKR